MKSSKNFYANAKNNSKHITEIATKLEFMAIFEDSKVLVEGKIREDYEESNLREIKNMITNIYLSLNLHEIQGMADEIFNKDFKPVE